jgi:D-methionine transport system ATP-binding protein
MIELKNVSKTFHKHSGAVHALSDVSLQVAAGEIFGVIGASGAGKSTLIRCINLLEKPTGGEVIVDGSPLLTLTPRRLAQERRHIGMIFQHFNLLSSRTVHENVAFPLELSGTPRDTIDARVTELLALVGLTDKRSEYPASLSGGQKQRVAIARTLASNPKVLLCDEATSALDPETTRSILELLKDINRRFGITILLITHEMNVIKAICDRVAIMSEGRIIEQGTVGAIFSHPRTELTRRFIASSLHFAIPPEYATRLKQTAARSRGEGPQHAGAPGGQTPGNTAWSTGEAPAHPLVRLEFTAESAGLPLLSTVSRQLNVDHHIVSAQLDQAGGANFGFMLVEITGTAENTQKAVDYYIAHQVKAEVLGYV